MNDNGQNKGEDSYQKKASLSWKFLKFTGVFALIFSLVLVLTAAVFEKEIADLVIEAINDQLKTSLEVEYARLSLIRKFPSATVYLYNATLKGRDKDEKAFLEVGSLSLECSIWGLLNKTYDFNTLNLNDGSMYIHIERDGNFNGNVFKSSDAKESNLDISIKNAYLNDFEILYKNEYRQHTIADFVLKTAFFEGDFMVDNALNLNSHKINTYLELDNQYLSVGDKNYLKGKSIEFEGQLELDLEQEIYTFKEIEFSVEGNIFSLDGGISKTQKGDFYDLVLEGKEAKLDAMFQFIPDEFHTTFGGFESDANLQFKALLKGYSNDFENPDFKVDFGVKDGRLMHPLIDGKMKNVHFDLSFNIGTGNIEKTATLNIKDFKAEIDGEPISLNWNMKGFENPLINFSMNGNIPLRSIYRLFGDRVSNASGLVKIDQFGINGHLNDMLSMSRIPLVKLKGLVSFEQAFLALKNVGLEFVSGGLMIDNNDFGIEALKINFNSSDMELTGRFNNALPVLLSDSINSNNSMIDFETSLLAEQINVDEILEWMGGFSKEEIQTADTEDQQKLKKYQIQRRAFLSTFLNGSFASKIKSLKYGAIVLEDFEGKIEMASNLLSLKSVQAKTLDGNVGLNAKIFLDQNPKAELFIDCEEVDLKQMMLSMNNFGQEAITHEHLNGVLKSLIKVELKLDSFGHFQHQDLFVVADVEIKNGELNNLKMLEGFSEYIKLKDLQNIAFSNLKNQFRIEKGKLYIPAMFIQSNAVNLLVGGEYGFDHEMDFKIKINAGQLFANKFKKYNPKKEALKAEKKGLFIIFANIFGNLYGDYEYKIGAKHAKKYLDNQLDLDLPALSSRLRKEFEGFKYGVFLKSETEEIWENIPEFDWDGEIEYIKGY